MWSFDVSELQFESMFSTIEALKALACCFNERGDEISNFYD